MTLHSSFRSCEDPINTIADLRTPLRMERQSPGNIAAADSIHIAGGFNCCGKKTLPGAYADSGINICRQSHRYLMTVFTFLTDPSLISDFLIRI